MDDLVRNGKLRLNYTTDLNYITGDIFEYDIKKANLMILTKNMGELGKVFDFSEVQTLLRYLDNESLDKKIYQIFIGNLMRKYDWLSDYIHDYVRLILTSFITENNIAPVNVISIKKDALFVMGKSVSQLHPVGFELVCKHKFSQFYTFKVGRRDVEVYSSNREVIVKNLIGGRYENLVKFVHRNLIDKIIPLDKHNQFNLIERFENNFLDGKFTDDLSIYHNNGKISLTNGYSIMDRGLDPDFIRENINIPLYYSQMVKPMIQSFIRGN